MIDICCANADCRSASPRRHSDHDVSPSFEWEEKYREQLQLLAETDEMAEDIKWPPLKDAIKYLLKETLHSWPSSSSPVLHPAAALIPLHSNSLDESSLSSTSLPGIANGNGTNGDHSSDQGAGPSIHAAGLSLHNRFAREEQREGFGQDQGISVKEADMQAFFPSKRQAPGEWRGSWGKRIDTEDELKREQANVFSMLDDFENQPPFTIQRLSELVLRPTEHHHTVPKYISALKRLLSVTATRDAFPAHPAEEDEMATEYAQLDTEVLNGVATPSSAASRSRRATPVPGSPTTAPLFSPIPFLMKSGDEGMPGSGPALEQDKERIGEQDMPMSDRDVPLMELGGADRTTEVAAEQAMRAGKGVGSNRSISDSIHEAETTDAEADAEAESVPLPSNDGVETVQKAAPGPSTSDEADMGRAGELAATSSMGMEPLGVPAGPVDEVDQVGEKHGQLQPLGPGTIAGGARAFSSTTSTAPAAVMTSTSEEQEQSEREQGIPPESSDGDSVRALKRVRSERHLDGDGDSKQQ